MKHVTATNIASKEKASKSKPRKLPKKLVRRTIEEALRGVSASDSMSDSSCSTVLSSGASSADESDVLSLVSQVESLDGSLSGVMHEEAEEIQVRIINWYLYCGLIHSCVVIVFHRACFKCLSPFVEGIVTIIFAGKYLIFFSRTIYFSRSQAPLIAPSQK